MAEANGTNVVLHQLQFPKVEHKHGPIVADMRNVQVLTALDNFLQFCNVPRAKVVAARKLLVWAIQLEDQTSWNQLMLGLMMETAKEGFRSQQAVDVLIAEQQAKHRLEAFQKLNEMGPRPKASP